MSIEPIQSDLEIIEGLCMDLDLSKTIVDPYWWQLSRESKTVDVMTISLTMNTGGKWSYYNTIQKVREQIINYFK